MAVKSSPRARAKLRFQISISPDAVRMWRALAARERRNRSNTLEVLIDREFARVNADK